jgi:hypothetical protein
VDLVAVGGFVSVATYQFGTDHLPGVVLDWPIMLSHQLSEHGPVRILLSGWTTIPAAALPRLDTISAYRWSERETNVPAFWNGERLGGSPDAIQRNAEGERLAFAFAMR